MMMVLCVFIGLIIGSISVGFWFYMQLQKKNLEQLVLQKDFELQKEKLEELKNAEEKSQSLELENVRLKTQLTEQQERFENELRLQEENFQTIKEEQEKSWEEQKKALKVEFHNIANQILEDKTKSFTDLNKERLDELEKIATVNAVIAPK